MDEIGPSAVDVRCHVRSPPEPAVETRLDTLRACEESGAIGGLTVRGWPSAVALESDWLHQTVIDRFIRYTRWAAARNVAIRPPFEIRTVTSLVREGSQRVLTTPAFCIALVHDDDLLGVYPHSTPETTRTAPEVVDALEAGVLPPLAGAADADGDGVSTSGPPASDAEREG